MSTETNVIAAIVTLGTQLTIANATQSAVKDLHQLGINPDYVVSSFHETADIRLNLSEALKVTYEDEGKNIRFETLDNFSIVVAIGDALGVANKYVPPESMPK